MTGQEEYAVVAGCVVVGVGCVQRVLVGQWCAGTENVAMVGQALSEVVVEHRTKEAVENRADGEQDEIGLYPDLEPAASVRQDVHTHIIAQSQAAHLFGERHPYYGEGKSNPDQFTCKLLSVYSASCFPESNWSVGNE